MACRNFLKHVTNFWSYQIIRFWGKNLEKFKNRLSFTMPRACTWCVHIPLLWIASSNMFFFPEFFSGLSEFSGSFPKFLKISNSPNIFEMVVFSQIPVKLRDLNFSEIWEMLQKIPTARWRILGRKICSWKLFITNNGMCTYQVHARGHMKFKRFLGFSRFLPQNLIIW